MLRGIPDMGKGVLTCRDIITSWYLRDTQGSSGLWVRIGNSVIVFVHPLDSAPRNSISHLWAC